MTVKSLKDRRSCWDAQTFSGGGRSRTLGVLWWARFYGWIRFFDEQSRNFSRVLPYTPVRFLHERGAPTPAANFLEDTLCKRARKCGSIEFCVLKWLDSIPNKELETSLWDIFDLGKRPKNAKRDQKRWMSVLQFCSFVFRQPSQLILLVLLMNLAQFRTKYYII